VQIRPKSGWQQQHHQQHHQHHHVVQRPVHAGRDEAALQLSEHQGVAASAAAAGGGGVGGGAITTGPSSGTNGGLSGMVIVLPYRGIGIIILPPSISIHLAVG